MVALAKKEPALALDPAENFRGPSGPALDELLKRVWFTLGALLVFRFCSYIPIPGPDPDVRLELVPNLFPRSLTTADALVGGGLGRMSVFALGLVPYFAAVLIMRLLAALLLHSGEPGPNDVQKRRSDAQKTRLLTGTLAAVMAYGLAIGLESIPKTIAEPGWVFRITTVAALTTGAMFLMWLSEQVTRRGIGHGPSLIVATGLVAGLPYAVSGLWELYRTDSTTPGDMLALLAMIIAIVGAVVFFERARSRILMNVPRRHGEAGAGDLRLKLNGAGFLPPLLASVCLSVLSIGVALILDDESAGLERFRDVALALELSRWPGVISFVSLIVLFAILFKYATHDPADEARKLADAGGFVPGIRPGDRTTAYLRRTQDRLAVIGACYLAIVCAVPVLLFSRVALPIFEINAGLVIVIIVILDLIERLHQAVLSARSSGR